MFANNSRRNTNVSVVKSCKFCKDAGKSLEEYSSHFIRETKDPNSRIVCPTLLAIECRYCFKRGHTVSKCKKLIDEKNGNNTKKQTIPGAPVKKAYNGSPPKMNAFNILSDFSDSDNEEEDISLGDTISTCLDCKTDDSISSVETLTYAQMLAKPAPILAEVGSRISILTKGRMMRCWADSDSDDE